MDINFIREAITVVSFVVFIGILAWAYSPANRERFEQDARLPFEEDAKMEERS
jgi:cytochrome c oxidase cbb3-type subunit 4